MRSFVGMEGGRGRTRRRHEWRCVWTDRDDGSMEGRACQGPVLVVVVVAALLWCWLMDGSFASTFTVNTKKAQERDRPAEWMSGRVSRYSQRHTAWKTSETPLWDVLTGQPDTSLTPWDVCQDRHSCLVPARTHIRKPQRRSRRTASELGGEAKQLEDETVWEKYLDRI